MNFPPDALWSMVSVLSDPCVTLFMTVKSERLGRARLPAEGGRARVHIRVHLPSCRAGYFRLRRFRALGWS